MSDDLRDRIAEAIHTPHHLGGKPVGECVSACWQRADAVMAVVEPEIDLLRQALGEIRGDIGTARALLGQHDCAAVDPSDTALDGPDGR